MTAYKVLDDHNDLDNIGSLTHNQLDGYINTSPFILVSGVIGEIPPNSRLLSGSGITITDGGPGGVLTLTSTGGGGSPPGGNPGEVQFNDGGVFGGDSNFTFNKTTDTLTVTNLSGSLTKLSDGTPYLVAGTNISISTGSNGSITISAPAPTVVQQTSWMEVVSGSTDGINNVFSLNYPPNPTNALMFYVNGVLQRPGTGHDYTLAYDSIAMSYAPGSGSNLVATYTYNFTPLLGTNTSWMEVPSGLVDGANSTFALTNIPLPSSALMFYVNGVLQRQGIPYDYTISNNIISMNYAAPSGSNLIATYPY